LLKKIKETQSKILEKIKYKINKFKTYFNNLDFTNKIIFIFLSIIILDILTTGIKITLKNLNETNQLKNKEVKIINFKKKSNLSKIKQLKVIKDNSEFLSIEYSKLNDNKKYVVKNIPIYDFIKNFVSVIEKNNIDYKWVKKDQKNFLNNFFILEKIKENFIRIIFIFIILIILEKQGLFSNKDKYQIIDSKNIKGNMDELIGLEDIKIEILQLENMIKNKDKYLKYGLDKTFNILFAGPAGTGKTKIASLLAKRLNIPIIVGTGNVETGFINGGVSVIKELFEKAREIAKKEDHKTCIIFLDEAQTLLLKRGQSRDKWADDSANELLAQLDGINTKSNLNIIFIAASNFDDKNHDFDEAMMRRFKKKIFFRKPNSEERVEIIKLYLNKIEKKYINEFIDFEYLSEIMSNLSPAIIETIIQETSLIAINKNCLIDTKLIEQGFERITVGLTDRKKSKDKDKIRHIISKHEIGHFITEYQLEMDKIISREEFSKLNKEEKKEKILYIKYHLKTLKISIESIAQINALGYVLNKTEEYNLKTKKELEEEIISLYGGVASEHVFFDEDNITTGSSNDIEKISNIFNIMVNKLGMYTNRKLNFSLISNVNIEDENIAILTKNSELLYNEAKHIIEINKDLVIFLSETLEKKYILTLNETIDLIIEFFNKK